MFAWAGINPSSTTFNILRWFWAWYEYFFQFLSFPLGIFVDLREISNRLNIFPNSNALCGAFLTRIWLLFSLGLLCTTPPVCQSFARGLHSTYVFLELTRSTIVVVYCEMGKGFKSYVASKLWNVNREIKQNWSIPWRLWSVCVKRYQWVIFVEWYCSQAIFAGVYEILWNLRQIKAKK